MREDQTSPTVGCITTEVLLTESFDHSSITALRHAVASRVREAGLTGERLDDFVLAVNELLTNAVRHGGGLGRVALWRQDLDLVCEVSDSGAGLAEPRPVTQVRPAADQPGGWGLWLAQELTDSFQLSTGVDGTTVRVTSRVSLSES
ncbi:ATP-binding protein [Actinoplanes sp. KI2]|uniref:ATP-binding protein n=1 Tax=Actinoplanes sp. KI2 TaxID=2983315 RepID=UPI0021D5CB47|nr:ATP-binding protein [Actinoplanes sp. KI2]MCU7724464.1 ATP-binding protein [Actinoplanes sp. KI2]